MPTLLIVALLAQGQPADLEELLAGSKLVVAGKVVSHRDSVEPGRKLALVEAEWGRKQADDAPIIISGGRVYVSFSTAKGARALEVGKPYLMFLTRKREHGECYPVDDAHGIEPLDAARAAEAQRLCDRNPFCSYEHLEVVADGKDRKCATCARKTGGSNVQSCRTCALKAKTCRVCGKAYKVEMEPLVLVELVTVRKREPIVELEKEARHLEEGKPSGRLSVGETLGLVPFEDEAILEVEGDAVESFLFWEGETEWAGVRGVKKGKCVVRVYLETRSAESFLAREVELTVE